MRSTNPFALVLVISLAVCCFASTARAEELKKPSWIHVLKNPESTTARLKKLLEDKDLLAFYDLAHVYLTELSQKNKDKKRVLTEEELKEILWIRYLIASAPFVDHLEDMKNYEWLANHADRDYTVKRNSLRRLSPQKMLNQKENINFKTGEAIEIYLTTNALVINQFKKRIDPDFKTKRDAAIKKHEDDYSKKIDSDPSGMFYSILNVRERRNMVAKGYLPFLEKSFISIMLELFYPNKPAEVKRYIQMAGYTEEEIPALMDRTAGRTPQTEVFYKGTKGKRES